MNRYSQVHLPGLQDNWDKQENRRAWEEEFFTAYIQPCLLQIDQLIQNANTAMRNDKRLGK